MDVTPSYSSVWRGRDGNAGGWRPGRSRLNVSSSISVPSSSSPGSSSSPPTTLSVSARLHPLPCLPGGAALFGPLAYSASTAYRHTGDVGTEASDGAGRGGQPAEILGLRVSSGKRRSDNASSAAAGAAGASSQVVGSATFPFLVDYDAAGSVVLYADDAGTGGEDATPSSSSPAVPLACCSLSPPPPDFPEEWSAVIEANVRDKGYTMVVRQLYSASNKKVRLDVHSLGEFFDLFFVSGSSGFFFSGFFSRPSSSSSLSFFSLLFLSLFLPLFSLFLFTSFARSLSDKEERWNT